MALDIGRKGWVGVGVESSYGAPVAITDYIPFNENSLKGMSEKVANEAAYGVRERVFDSVIAKQWAEGDVSINVDSKLFGYFLYSALGTNSPANVAGSVYDHTMSRNNSVTPKSLTIVNDRVVDRQYVTGAAVKSLNISVSDGLASAQASILGKYPITTTSGTLTTTSGSIFSFKDNFFAFAATPSAALSATNLKPSELTINIENNSEPVFRHGSAGVDAIVHKEFEVTAEGTLFFENTTDRDAYYNNTKQGAAMKLTGAGIGGGYSEAVTLNMYRVQMESWELETGLADFYAEKFSLRCEYDNANSKSFDAIIRNTKTSY